MQSENNAFDEFNSQRYVETYVEDVMEAIDYGCLNENLSCYTENNMQDFYSRPDPEFLPYPPNNCSKVSESMQVEGPGARDPLSQFYSQEHADFDYETGCGSFWNSQQLNAKGYESKEAAIQVVSTNDSDYYPHQQMQGQFDGEGFSTPEKDICCYSQEQMQMQVFQRTPQTPYSNSTIDDDEGCFQGEKIRNKKKDSKNKSAQNPRRNGPGLIINRVKVLLVNYLKQYDEESDSEFYYIQNIINQFNLTSEQLKGFERFMKHFQMQRKTWKNIEENLAMNKLFASIFISVVVAFLSKAGERDFEAWIGQGELTSGKVTLKDEKEWFREQFQKKFAHLVLVQV